MNVSFLIEKTKSFTASHGHIRLESLVALREMGWGKDYTGDMTLNEDERF